MNSYAAMNILLNKKERTLLSLIPLTGALIGFLLGLGTVENIGILTFIGVNAGFAAMNLIMAILMKRRKKVLEQYNDQVTL